MQGPHPVSFFPCATFFCGSAKDSTRKINVMQSYNDLSALMKRASSVPHCHVSGLCVYQRSRGWNWEYQEFADNLKGKIVAFIAFTKYGVTIMNDRLPCLVYALRLLVSVSYSRFFKTQRRFVPHTSCRQIQDFPTRLPAVKRRKRSL